MRALGPRVPQRLRTVRILGAELPEDRAAHAAHEQRDAHERIDQRSDDHGSGDQAPTPQVTYSASVSDRTGIRMGQLPSTEATQILWRRNSVRPMTMRWISDVPSPISSSGASRYRRSISYSFEYP